MAQAARDGARHLLVVCHSGVIRALHEHFLALTLSRIIPVGPPSLTSLRLDAEGAARLDLFNLTPGYPEFAAPD